MKGGPFGEKKNRKKSQNAEQKLKGGTLWDFPTSILSQNSKKFEEETLWGKKFPAKKSRSADKNWRGTLRPRRCDMLRGKTVKIFLVQFARPNSAIWCNNIL